MDPLFIKQSTLTESVNAVERKKLAQGLEKPPEYDMINIMNDNEHGETIETRTIPVTVDKSHLITIGEKLYTEKSSFVRELVNNAFDADATEARVEISDERVVIRDNGSGMDEGGLRQYFTIGSTLKRSSDTSPIFGRKRIGEFGIGKFAALAACSRFEIETQKGNFRARLSFDKEKWAIREDWRLDIHLLPPKKDGQGTTITLLKPNIPLIPGKIRRYLSERTPIHAPDFSVFVNDERVSDDIITGKHIVVEQTTPHGGITGTIIILPEGKKIENTGVSVHVKGVLIRRENFGLSLVHRIGATRIVGRIYADFLPVTSSRDDFLRDSDEFLAFETIMKKEIDRALKTIREEGNRKADLEASRVLQDALQKIGKAMRRHKGIFPEAQVPVGERDKNDADDADSPPEKRGEGYAVGKAQFLPSGEGIDPALKEKLGKNGKGIRRGRGILGARSVVRNLTFAGMEIAVRMEHLGDQDESLVSGGVIYINLDHALYQTYRGKDDILAIHLSRIITKELTLHAGISNATDAFALQSELLTDALREKKRG